MAEEVIIADQDSLYRWDGPKRKQTLLSGTLGRLVLTNARLMFLSTGKHDITLGRIVAGAGGNTFRSLSSGSTTHLDLDALSNKGSISVPIGAITSAELKGMFKFLSVSYVLPDGSAAASAFAPKNGGMPSGAAWVTAIEQGRGQ